MKGNIWLLVPVLLPVFSGLAISLFKMEDRKTRNVVVALTTLANAAILLFAFGQGDSLEILRITDTISIAFHIDNLGKLFTVLASALWFFASIYAFEYMKHEGNEVRFFSFLTITLGAMMGLGFAGNLLTFYLFFEMMTLASYPLVVNSLSDEAKKAGVKYLVYSLLGAALTLMAVMVVYAYGSTLSFVPGGVLITEAANQHKNFILGFYFLAVLGYGAKAGLYPLHAWLPKAHPVAPAPASALLSGVITKAGVMGIIRMTYFVFGAEFVFGTWAHTGLLALTLLTVFLGSMLAFMAKQLKVRLAYSSLSQVSYVLFGVLLLNPDAFTGGALHMVFHALIKNVLFLSVGAVMYKMHKTRVDEMEGVGKFMPITMWCFTIASLGLIGIPPTPGFISKYYLAMGALSFPNQVLGYLGVAILITSALLTAGYLLPISIKAFFPGKDFDYSTVKNEDPKGPMLLSLVALTLIVVLVGIFPNQLVDFVRTIANGLF